MSLHIIPAWPWLVWLPDPPKRDVSAVLERAVERALSEPPDRTHEAFRQMFADTLRHQRKGSPHARD